MAQISQCPKCGAKAPLDNHCGGYCCNCLDNDQRHAYADHYISHKDDCPIVIERERRNLSAISHLQKSLNDKMKIISKNQDEIMILLYLLREIAPCPDCKGKIGNEKCAMCDGGGYYHPSCRGEIAIGTPLSTLARYGIKLEK